MALQNSKINLGQGELNRGWGRGGGVCAYFKIDRNDNRKIFMLNDFNG